VLLDGEAEADGARTALGPVPLHGAGATGPVRVMLRPEQIVPAPPGEGVAAEVLASAFRGDHVRLTVALGPVRLDLRMGALDEIGSRIWLRVVGSAVSFPR
jgi:iron(III) transport system ATP-binding protein